MSIFLPGSRQLNPPDEHPVFTRSGWQIPTLKPPMQDVRLVEIRANDLKFRRPRIIIRSMSPYPYNCVGMVFASRRAWIDTDHIYDILENDGYRLIGREQAMEGDVVLYKQSIEPTHVGIVISALRPHPTSSTVNIQVLSKWGKDAEFIHFIEDVPPQLGTPTEFYTERPLR